MIPSLNRRQRILKLGLFRRLERGITKLCTNAQDLNNAQEIKTAWRHSTKRQPMLRKDLPFKINSIKLRASGFSQTHLLKERCHEHEI